MLIPIAGLGRAVFFTLICTLINAASLLADDFAAERTQTLARIKDKNLSAAAYKDILKQINASVSQNGPEYAFSWIYGLDALFEAGKENYNFSEPAPELRKLGESLTLKVAPYLNLQSFGGEFVAIFYRWASNDLRFGVAQNQNYLIKADPQLNGSVENKKILMAWHARLAQVSRLLVKLNTAGSSLGRSYDLDIRTSEDTQQVIGTSDALVIGKLAEKIKTFADTDMDFILRDCLSEASIMTLLDRLEGFSLSVSDGPWLGKLVEWSLILFRKTVALGPDSPFALRAQPGRILVISLRKLLDSGQSLDLLAAGRIAENPGTPSEFKQATLDTLVDHIVRVLESPNLIEELAIRIANVYRQRLISDRQLDLVYLLAIKIGPKVAEDSFDLFNEFMQRVLVQKLRRDLGWEGIYEIKLGGCSATMTLGFTGGETLAVGISKYYSDRITIPITFDRVVYDLKNKKFESVLLDGEQAINFTLNRVWDENAGKFLNEVRGSYESTNSVVDQFLTGKQTFVLPPYKSEDGTLPWVPLTDATFVGGYVTGGERGTGEQLIGPAIRLRIRENESGLRAKVFKGATEIRRPFALPTRFVDHKKRLFFLTSKLVENEPLLQIRGHLSDDGNFIEGYEVFTGHYFRHIKLWRRATLPRDRGDFP
jgi:hypothetical protein